MNHHPEPSPKSDSDVTGTSEGVDYLQMYFGQSYDGLPTSADRLEFSLPMTFLDNSILADRPTGGAPTGAEFDAELASILFGTDEEDRPTSANAAGASSLRDHPAMDFDRPGDSRRPTTSEFPSAGRWNSNEMNHSARKIHGDGRVTLQPALDQLRPGCMRIDQRQEQGNPLHPRPSPPRGPSHQNAGAGIQGGTVGGFPSAGLMKGIEESAGGGHEEEDEVKRMTRADEDQRTRDPARTTQSESPIPASRAKQRIPRLQPSTSSDDCRRHPVQASQATNPIQPLEFSSSSSSSSLSPSPPSSSSSSSSPPPPPSSSTSSDRHPDHLSTDRSHQSQGYSRHTRQIDSSSGGDRLAITTPPTGSPHHPTSRGHGDSDSLPDEAHQLSFKSVSNQSSTSIRTGSSSGPLKEHPISPFRHPFAPDAHTPYSTDIPSRSSFEQHDQIRTSSFDLFNPMTSTSHPLQTFDSDSLDLTQLWSSFAPPVSSIPSESGYQLDSFDQFLSLRPTDAEDMKQAIELEFSHLVAEQQCAPSTPLSSNSLSKEPLAAGSLSTNSSRVDLENSPKRCSSLFHSSKSSEPTVSFVNDQGTSLYPHQSLSSFHDLRDLNDTFNHIINSFELSAPPAPPSNASQPVQSLVHPSPLSTSFLVTTTGHPQSSSPPIDPAFGLTTTSSSNGELQIRQTFEPSIASTSSLPSPINLPYPSAPTPQSGHPDRVPVSSLRHRISEPLHQAANQKTDSFLNRSQSYGTLTKSMPSAAEVPTEVESAVPRLSRLDLSRAYPDDLRLLLVGLQAEGAKTRVETQIKLTLVLLTGQGASIDPNGNLSTANGNNLSRIGNWSYIKLPAYSAIKRKSKKLIKTGIPPEETLFLEVAVVRASEPHDEIYCCSNCQVREQKRTQRKRDARVRPAQEIESDEAEQSIRPEDEKRKIVVFNCGQYVSFESGEVTLPTRITCYCRHHREKKGFRIKVTLRDHSRHAIASSITPPIMITDDHKAVAAAAKAKSGSDLEDNQSRPRLIRKLPQAGMAPTASSVPQRAKKKLIACSGEAASESQLPSAFNHDAQDRFDHTMGWGSTHIHHPTRLPSRVPLNSRSSSSKFKRKAPNDINVRANTGRRTASNQTATSCQVVTGSVHGNSFPNSKNDDLNGVYPHVSSLSSAYSSEECRPQSNIQPDFRTNDRSFSMPMSVIPSHLRHATALPAYPWDDRTSSPSHSTPHAEAKADLTGDVEMVNAMKETGQTVNPEYHGNPLLPSPILPMTPVNEKKSDEYPSVIARPPNFSDVPNLGLGSQLPQPPDRDGLHEDLASHNYRKPGRVDSYHPSTSPEEKTLIYPFSSQICTSPAPGSPGASPDSSIHSQQYNQFKYSNSTSPSSSIVCSQSRGYSDSSSRTSELNQTLSILPSQSDSSLDQQLARLPQTQNDTVRTASPDQATPMLHPLGNFLANWNLLSNMFHMPPDPVAPSEFKSCDIELPLASKDPADLAVNSELEALPGTRSRPKYPSARIRKLVPDEGPTEGGIEITILGDNFYPELKVDFGSGSVVRAEFWSSNTLVCILPPSARSGPCEVMLVDEENVQVRQNKTQGATFTYIDLANQKLMELALQVVGLKMTGQIQDVKSLARQIVGESKEIEDLDVCGSTPIVSVADEAPKTGNTMVPKVGDVSKCQHKRKSRPHMDVRLSTEHHAKAGFLPRYKSTQQGKPKLSSCSRSFRRRQKRLRASRRKFSSPTWPPISLSSSFTTSSRDQHPDWWQQIYSDTSRRKNRSHSVLMLEIRPGRIRGRATRIA